MVQSPSIQDLAKLLRDTGRSFWAVWAVIGTIVVFLIIHGRIDRRDPKLASAPLTDELLEFT